MRVLITGADGFVGRNLRAHLAERPDVDVVTFTRDISVDQLPGLLDGVQLVFHLAGVNRPQDPAEFQQGNAELTRALCAALRAGCAAGNRTSVVFTSSSQAIRDNDYGRSKREAEEALRDLARDTGLPVHLFRLPNVFGKWCRIKYNSAVATFCHNIARDLPVTIHDPDAALTLVYIDDVVRRFLEIVDGHAGEVDADGFAYVTPTYATTVGALAAQIRAFKASRGNLLTERVGTSLVRALHATYLSYLPPDDFAYPLVRHADSRGVFVEMLKTPDCGQFSFFSAGPGVTRGGHYHHSKTEKFLVLKGQARYRFRHIDTGETFVVETDGERAEVVETVPGWAHDITNVGTEEMFVMLWANEIFDRSRPDTYAHPLSVDA